MDRFLDHWKNVELQNRRLRRALYRTLVVALVEAWGLGRLAMLSLVPIANGRGPYMFAKKTGTPSWSNPKHLCHRPPNNLGHLAFRKDALTMETQRIQRLSIGTKTLDIRHIGSPDEAVCS